ncbi:MAG: methylmalonyl Co-A mutase-associated GTPase MeaB [Patulibacter sp.]
MIVVPDDLGARLQAGEKRALARAITIAETDDQAGWRLVQDVYATTGDAAIVGITGPPGAGKSTLINALTTVRRAQQRDVAVLSVDPSSPFTNGAVLGDRIRLTEHYLDPGVFIRSMANRGALGGLSGAALQATLLMDASGKDDVFIETVGVGQAEVDIVTLADTVVLVLVPGSGDAVQALKAGVMEIPDVIVVNKADHPTAGALMQQVRSALSLVPHEGETWKVPLLKVQSDTGVGIEALADAIDEHRRFLAAGGTLIARREERLREAVLTLAGRAFRRRLVAAASDDAAVAALLASTARSEIDPFTASSALLERLAR